jgi:hemolysin III
VTDASAPVAPRRAKPRLRGRLHQVAFFVSIPAGFVLLLAASTAGERIAVCVYWSALVVQFGVSARYHLGRWEGPALARMRRLDHSAIYLLIAGTYTVIAWIALSGTARTVVLLVAWLGAAAGIATKLYRTDLHVLSGILYIGLGWFAVPFLPAIAAGLPAVSVLLIVVGGLLYTVGALVLAKRRPDPFPSTFGYQEVWHAATIAAAACQFAAILIALLAS